MWSWAKTDIRVWWMWKVCGRCRPPQRGSSVCRMLLLRLRWGPAVRLASRPQSVFLLWTIWNNIPFLSTLHCMIIKCLVVHITISFWYADFLLIWPFLLLDFAQLSLVSEFISDFWWVVICESITVSRHVKHGIVEKTQGKLQVTIATIQKLNLI